jgi:hypothetical protein
MMKMTRWSGAVLMAVVVVGGWRADARAACGALRAGESLNPDQSISTCNGQGRLVHQGDGNVVFYDQVGASWATGTNGRSTRALVMQGDGNLVLYGTDSSALWHSQTWGNPGAWLAVQDDCNLVIYSAAQNVLWASNTSCRSLPALGGVKGKTIAGYQGWFAAPGDGSPVDRWDHWGAGVVSPGNVTFELYPDVREYPALFQTDLGNLGNGSPARLFSSYSTQTIDLHFRWMREYNIDGAALVRFGGELVDPARKAFRDSIAGKVRSAAEANGRIFYVMYDVSGMSGSFVQQIKDDWTNTMLASLQITSSPSYAKESGKPVVALWGVGFRDRPGTPSEWTNLINWFKNRGVYVIGGVPWEWRTGGSDVKVGFEGVFTAVNMISPWTIGAYQDDSQVDGYKTNRLVPDRNYCNARGIDYQPVVWPGFAWSNWKPDPRNWYPRRRGGLFWRQAFNIKDANMSTMFIAMFDEYDEGTAIAKAAENSSMIPTNQYFLTLDADGTALSSDFYLRLADAANRMLKGELPLDPDVPIPNF